MATGLEAAPILSTPETHIFEAYKNPAPRVTRRITDDELRVKYDIDRTLKEIRQGKWKRIALQFPDDMLPDAPRVFQLLSRDLANLDSTSSSGVRDEANSATGELATDYTANGTQKGDVDDVTNSVVNSLKISGPQTPDHPRLYILADTSYGTCCVDEVAAEHINADVVVHYGRACLSPTARLPVIYIFTRRELDAAPLIEAFKETYPNREEKVVIAADVTFADYVEKITSTLAEQEGYTNLFATSVVHNPSSPIPNRTVPGSVSDKPESLREWQLFHISNPPTALLLTLSSRVATIHIYSTDEESGQHVTGTRKPLLASTAITLRRRYAILTSLSTVPIFGVLINTLSVKNYLHIVEHVKAQIAAAGKKSYIFVVGKLNAAKVANFSEIGGWVVIGCWESSLVDSSDFWKPVITPFELELTLKSDMDRVWTGEWQSDYQAILDITKARNSIQNPGQDIPQDHPTSDANSDDDGDDVDAGSEEESAPPEFDLRTGRYISVSSTRPMQPSSVPTSSNTPGPSAQAGGSKALAKRQNADLATINGVLSPGAEFLRSQRTWQGLGSDFDIRYEEDGEQGAAVVEGRSGIARGYTVGEIENRH
ncbi:diphthamide biosynthesis protein Dph2 [Blastomyces dermatitidis ATCC 18188]|uniref:2-(3-amino-3-carboxypropyl)histidine synthase subunit 2 n=1 Tax=Ajellomyces dermatitidis (strain ATCC 18188 / CBS 674.68) TaxID=653446 RepID=F2TGQ6_AJEDA|nr:diphthamide biosynthesis protein Dph2 [Blastomyces dermatitidis ATCC 18188]